MTSVDNLCRRVVTRAEKEENVVYYKGESESVYHVAGVYPLSAQQREVPINRSVQGRVLVAGRK